MANQKYPFTRRAFLRSLTAMGGVGAAYSFMSALEMFGEGALAQGNTTADLPRGSMDGKTVAVLGAGLSGLCCAYRLALAGARVVILEETDRAGGRSLTLRHGNKYKERQDNESREVKFEKVGDVEPDDAHNYLNAGPGRIPQHHHRTIDYCGRFNVALEPYIYYDNANLMQNDAWNDEKPVQLRRLTQDLNGQLAELLANVPDTDLVDAYVSANDIERFREMMRNMGDLTYDKAQKDPYYFPRQPSRPNQPGDAWFRRSGYLTEPGNAVTPGVQPDTLTIGEIMASDLNFRDKGDSSMRMFNSLWYFWQASLLQPKDGMDKINDGFLDARLPGGTVRDLITFSDPVAAMNVSQAPGKVRVVTQRGRVYTFDQVVATVSPKILSEIRGDFIDPDTRQALAEIVMSPSCKVGFQAKNRFWEKNDRIYGGISWTRHIASQIWYPSYDFNSPTGILTGAYNSGTAAAVLQKMSHRERIASAVDAGEKLHPGVYRDNVFHENGISIAWANMEGQSGGWANFTAYRQPNVFQAVVAGEAAQPQVFFAGDWFSYWPGWIVGALDAAHYATDRMAGVIR